MYISSKERAKVIRKELVKSFGKDNVSVTKGTGTASSWVTARVKAERPLMCLCKFSDKNWRGETVAPHRIETYCEFCHKASNETRELAESISRKAMKANGYEHSTYYADDGYNTETSEFLMQIDVK